MKKYLISLCLLTSLFATDKASCENKNGSFIYAKGECIEYKKYDGENDEALNIIIHGTWEEGSDTIARYSPLAEDIALRSDISTLAIALPAYSKSSSNKLLAIGNKKVKNLAATKEYVEFLGVLVENLKEKYKSSKITLIAHSAGCMMSATLLGIKEDLVDNLVCMGGIYDIHKRSDDKSLISAIDIVDKISKKVKIVLVYGTLDDISTPQMTKDFYKLAKQKGLDVTLLELKDLGHMDLDSASQTKEAIEKLLEE